MELKVDVELNYDIIKVWNSEEYAGIDKKKFSADDVVDVYLIEFNESKKGFKISIEEIISLNYLGSSRFWSRNKSNQLLLPVKILKDRRNNPINLANRYLLITKTEVK